MAWIRILAAALVPASASWAAAESTRVEFDDIPRLVQERNLAARGAALRLQAAESRRGALARSFLPNAAAGAGAERFQTGDRPYETQPYGAVEARVNLLHGGKDYWNERRLESLTSGARAQSEELLAALVAEARKTYLRLVHAREMGLIVKEAAEENLKLLDRAERRIKRGLATATDRLDFEIGASQLREDRESFSHAELQLRLRLAALLGASPGAEIETAQELEHVHDDSLLARAFDPSAHRDARARAALSEGAAAESRSAALWWAPSLDVYAGKYLYTFREREHPSSRLRDDFAVGGKLSLSLFDGGRERRESRAKRLEAEGERRRLEQTLTDVRARVRVIEEDLKHDHDLVHFAEERIGMARRYLDATLDEYDRGIKNSPDVLAAAQRLLGYRRALAERRRDYLLTKVELLREHGL